VNRTGSSFFLQLHFSQAAWQSTQAAAIPASLFPDTWSTQAWHKHSPLRHICQRIIIRLFDRPHLAPGTLVTDAGSTKRNVIEAFYLHLGGHLAHAVPGHPIAGAEKSGCEAADATLFRGRKVVLTPLPENEPGSVLRVAQLWQACGAIIREMSPQEHDRVFAAVSHLPHVLAYALVHDLAERANAEQLFEYAAGGFRDFTRIAASHPEMWRDICLVNRQAILAELDQYLSELAFIRALLLSANGPGLEEVFAKARAARMAWGERYVNDANGGGPTNERLPRLPPARCAQGSARLPGSKEHAPIRVLLLAALAEGDTHIHDLLHSDDVARMLEALEALADGIDLYITGEPSHSIYHYMLEGGMNFVAAGHYATETWGVKAVAEKAQAELGLETLFIDVPTGL